MADTVIKVEGLSKQYRLGLDVPAGTLGEALASFVKSPLRPRRSASPDGDTLWALRAISFDVARGQTVGVIGRNGAGKSTLLKILSQITVPTEGRAEMRGRVGSLLEIGTGFHPELTGRENTYLYGAILGMDRASIRTRFDEIVAFAELERFIDTPVKKYSSGMYMRLAFAVAAHLDAQILLVDEVLAVGDSAFQRKCIGKMDDVARGGRTVLFVSHNMSAVSQLCSRCIVLGKGEVLYDGDARSAVSVYNQSVVGAAPSVERCASRSGSGGIRITRLWMTDEQGAETLFARSGGAVTIHLTAQADARFADGAAVAVAFALDAQDGRRLFTCISLWSGVELRTRGSELSARCELTDLPLLPDTYLLSASIIHHRECLDNLVHCGSLEVRSSEGDVLVRDEAIDYGLVSIPHTFAQEG
jgi:lipopolysaccharide transport system ATP-binding protein